MATYFDDNFGQYEFEGDEPTEEELAFYHQMQRESVEKQCSGCGRTVMLRPEYGYCDCCATKREQGWDI